MIKTTQKLAPSICREMFAQSGGVNYMLKNSCSPANIAVALQYFATSFHRLPDCSLSAEIIDLTNVASREQIGESLAESLRHHPATSPFVQQLLQKATPAQREQIFVDAFEQNNEAVIRQVLPLLPRSSQSVVEGCVRKEINCASSSLPQSMIEFALSGCGSKFRKECLQAAIAMNKVDVVEQIAATDGATADSLILASQHTEHHAMQRIIKEHYISQRVIISTIEGDILIPRALFATQEEYESEIQRVLSKYVIGNRHDLHNAEDGDLYPVIKELDCYFWYAMDSASRRTVKDHHEGSYKYYARTRFWSNGLPYKSMLAAAGMGGLAYCKASIGDKIHLPKQNLLKIADKMSSFTFPPMIMPSS